MSFMILIYAVPSMNTLVSFANSIENNKSDDLEKSLTYQMKRRGPEYGFLAHSMCNFYFRMAIVLLNKLFNERKITFKTIEYVAPDSILF